MNNQTSDVRNRKYAISPPSIKANGYLVSVERYEDDSMYTGLLCALNRLGFCQMKGTHIQFFAETETKLLHSRQSFFKKP